VGKGGAPGAWTPVLLTLSETSRSKPPETPAKIRVSYWRTLFSWRVMRTMVLLASALLVGGTVEAQGTAQGRARTMDEARRAESEATMLRDRVMQRVMVDDSAAMNRATLGLTLGGATTKRDTLGVFVEAVAEDGPAERAGVFEGHRIAYINNVDVRASAADAGDPYLSTVGRHRLMRAMRDVRAGGTVTLRVWTGSGYRDVQLTAARFADVYKNQHFGGMLFGTPGMSFAPSMERMRIEAPMERHIEIRPSEVPRNPLRGATPTPRSPRVMVAPSVNATPRVIATPHVMPTPAGVRRYTI